MDRFEFRPQTSESVNLKIAVIQLESIYKSPEETYEKKVKAYMEKLKGKPLDFIILPEMALMGYDFEKREDVYPFCEKQKEGYNFQVAQNLAKEFNSYCVIGYPEKMLKEDGEEVLYNSCYLVDREGELVYNYRKILLYDTDKRYFEAGEENQRPCLKLKTLEGKEVTVGIGICMDINYKDFKEFFEFPLANYCRDSKIELLLFPTAWTLQGEEEVDEKMEERERGELYQYWTVRMLPNISAAFQISKDVGDRNEKEWVFVAADRCGKERETCYKGLSCVMKFNVPGKRTPYVVEETMGIKEEGVRYVQTNFRR